MRPVEKVLELVERFEERPNGFWCVCPAHEDHDPSLHVEEADDGRVLMVCRAGCSQPEVLAALERRGLKPRDLFADNAGGSVVPIRNGGSKASRAPARGNERLAASYAIRDAAGVLVALHERYEGASGHKRFAWKLPDGGYSKGAIRPAELPLYGAERVAGWPEGRGIVLVEGEKPAEALREAGIRALGTVTGAQGTPAEERLREVLEGRKVILWPDNDRAGREHMRRVAERLEGIAAAVSWYEWEEAEEKDDAADHPAVAGGDTAAVMALGA